VHHVGILYDHLNTYIRNSLPFSS